MIYSGAAAGGTGRRYSTRAWTAGRRPLSPAGRTPASDDRPSITPDGLTIFFDSDRYGTLGGPTSITRPGRARRSRSAWRSSCSRSAPGIRRPAVHQLGRDDADLFVYSAGKCRRRPTCGLNASEGDRAPMNPRLADGHHPWTEPLSRSSLAREAREKRTHVNSQDDCTSPRRSGPRQPAARGCGPPPDVLRAKCA